MTVTVAKRSTDDRTSTRWGLRSAGILGLLAAAGFLNYCDRQTLSILKADVKAALSMTDTHYSYVVAAFMVPYIVMYIGGGWIVDRLGTRRSLSLFVLVWSAASILTGAVHSLFQLAACRALLGLAEPGAFPATVQAIYKWFSDKDRTFAYFLLNSGTMASSVIVAPLIVYVAGIGIGWRGPFIVFGLAGSVLALLWFLFDTRKEERVQLPTSEPFQSSLASLLRHRGVRSVLILRAVSDPVYYFLLFWLPGYLQEKAHWDISAVGRLLWIPPLFSAVCGIAAGGLVTRWLKGGTPLLRSRVLLLRLAAFITPLLGSIPFLSYAPGLVSVICLVTAACSFYLVCSNLLVTDAVGPGKAGVALGIVGAAGALVALLANLITGPVVDLLGYKYLFLFGGLLHPIAYLWFTAHNRGASAAHDE